MSWIKVTDKKPEHDQWCWIFIPPKLVIYGCYDQDCGDWFYGSIENYWPEEEVTHWMPYFTPEPPHDV